MPTFEEKTRNNRIILAFLCLFLFSVMFGQATLYPLVLNYNYTVFPTNWYITILTFTIFTIAICIYICLRIIKNTYSDFVF